MHACACIYMHTCMHVFVCMQVCKCVCMCMYCVCMCVWMHYVCVVVYVHVLCMYVYVCMYVCIYMLHTFKALVKSADAEKKQSPILSQGSKHQYPNIFHKNFSPQINLTYPQTHATIYHEVYMHLSTLSKLSSNVQMQKKTKVQHYP